MNVAPALEVAGDAHRLPARVRLQDPLEVPPELRLPLRRSRRAAGDELVPNLAAGRDVHLALPDVPGTPLQGLRLERVPPAELFRAAHDADLVPELRLPVEVERDGDELLLWLFMRQLHARVESALREELGSAVVQLQDAVDAALPLVPVPARARHELVLHLPPRGHLDAALPDVALGPSQRDAVVRVPPTELIRPADHLDDAPERGLLLDLEVDEHLVLADILLLVLLVVARDDEARRRAERAGDRAVRGKNFRARQRMLRARRQARRARAARERRARRREERHDIHETCLGRTRRVTMARRCVRVVTSRRIPALEIYGLSANRWAT